MLDGFPQKTFKTGDRSAAVSDLQSNEERVLLQALNRQLSQKFLLFPMHPWHLIGVSNQMPMIVP